LLVCSAVADKEAALACISLVAAGDGLERGADAAIERGGALLKHLGAAQLGFLFLALVRGHLLGTDGVVLEYLHRGRHVADLVLAVQCRDLDRKVATGQRAHGAGHRVQRGADTTHHDGDQAGQHHDADQQRGDQALLRKARGTLRGFLGGLRGRSDHVAQLAHRPFEIFEVREERRVGRFSGGRVLLRQRDQGFGHADVGRQLRLDLGDRRPDVVVQRQALVGIDALAEILAVIGDVGFHRRHIFLVIVARRPQGAEHVGAQRVVHHVAFEVVAQRERSDDHAVELGALSRDAPIADGADDQRDRGHQATEAKELLPNRQSVEHARVFLCRRQPGAFSSVLLPILLGLTLRESPIYRSAYGAVIPRDSSEQNPVDWQRWQTCVRVRRASGTSWQSNQPDRRQPARMRAATRRRARSRS
jgi:hypothetical protein